MLNVKKARAAAAGSDATTVRYVDRMERKGASVTLRISSGARRIVIKDARPIGCSGSSSIASRPSRGCASASSRLNRGRPCRWRSSTDA